MSDIFPSTFSSFVPPLKHPESVCETKAASYGFGGFWKASKILLKENKIHFNPIIGCNNELKKLFLKFRKDSYFPRCYHPKHLNWNDVASCLKRNKFTSKNSLNRKCFRNRNTYLTNSYFTFGLKFVNKGTNHIYQTTNAPMLIYILPPPSSKNMKPEKCDFDLAQKNNSIFNARDQDLYNLYFLEPNRVYKIPDLTYYLIVTVQSTLFSVNIIKSETLLPFTLLRNPQDSKNYNRKRNNSINSRKQQTTMNHAQSGEDESMPLYPATNSSAEKMSQQTSSKNNLIISTDKQPYALLPSSSGNQIESSPHEDKREEICEDIISIVPTTSTEAGPEVYSPREDHRENVTITKGAMPFDLSVEDLDLDINKEMLSFENTEMSFKELFDFEFKFNEEMPLLSGDEALAYSKKK